MKDQSAAALAAPSTQNLWMGIAAVAIALMTWQATGQAGFLVMAGGVALLVPAWSLRAGGGAMPRWARGLLAPAVFLLVAGAFQILAR